MVSPILRDGLVRRAGVFVGILLFQSGLYLSLNAVLATGVQGHVEFAERHVRTGGNPGMPSVGLEEDGDGHFPLDHRLLDE